MRAMSLQQADFYQLIFCRDEQNLFGEQRWDLAGLPKLFSKAKAVSGQETSYALTQKQLLQSNSPQNSGFLC